MKAFTLTTLLVLGYCTQSTAQTIKEIYYDYRRMDIKERYSVNSKGEKHGKYTSFTRDGVVDQEGNYKNGLLEGLQKTYYAINGKQVLAQKETYHRDTLHGYAFYLSFNGSINEGNYKKGKKDGVWKTLTPYIPGEDEESKDANGLIAKIFYRNGEVVHRDGFDTIYFSPSKKIYTLTRYENEVEREQTVYYANGKKRGYVALDASGRKLEYRSWFVTGLREYEDIFYSDSTVMNSWYENGQLRSEEASDKEKKVYRFLRYNSDGTYTYETRMRLERERQK